MASSSSNAENDVSVPILAASISVALYSLLAIISLYYFTLLYQRRTRGSFYDYNHIPGEAKFARSKLVFFLSLSISAILDLPLYIGCVVQGGPRDCEWDDYSYSAFWTLHRLALGGYFISLGIPLIQWTDVIYTQDDNFFSKQNSRRFLYISTGLYCSLQIITSIAVFCASDAENHTSFAVSRFSSISNIFEAIFLVFIVAIWLWCGVRLQLYVMKVCFRPEAERRIIFMVNLVMFAVLLSYLLRAIMVLSLSVNFCGYYICNYIVWMIGTRWLPYNMCSFLLIYIMRRSADGGNSDYKGGVNISDIQSSLIVPNDNSSIASSTRSPLLKNKTSSINGSHRVRARTDTAGTTASVTGTSTNGSRVSRGRRGSRTGDTNSNSNQSRGPCGESPNRAVGNSRRGRRRGSARADGEVDGDGAAEGQGEVEEGGDGEGDSCSGSGRYNSSADDSRIDVVDIHVEDYDDDEGYDLDDEEDDDFDFQSQSSRSGLLSDELFPSDRGGYHAQCVHDSAHSITSIISFFLPKSSAASPALPVRPAAAAYMPKSTNSNDESNSDSMSRSSFQNVFSALFRNSSTNSSSTSQSLGQRTESRHLSNT